MGGNALKLVKTRRCSREEFDELSNELIDILNKKFNRVEIPSFFKEKESFGDIDILVCSNDEYNILNYIVDTFKPNEIYHNGNCCSFDYKGIQIDIITTIPENFDSLYMYMGFSDLGNFLGRIAQYLGVRYGDKGLYYKHSFKGSFVGDIIISKNQKEIYEFLGLSYDRYLEGFNKLEDIFEFVTTSKYFTKGMFQMDTLNATNRHRNSKRDSYVNFLEYIKDKEDKISIKPETNQDVIKLIKNHFVDGMIDMHIRELEYEHCKNLYINSKFNGGEILRRYGFKDKELGDIIKNFKKQFHSVDEFNQFILNSSLEDIYKIFETVMEIQL
jgi:hypothetical protein